MKVADIKLEWDKSASPNLDYVNVITVVDGVSATTKLDANLQEALISVNANLAYSFSIETVNKDGLKAMSVSFSGSTDDLEAPQPATNLRATIVAVRDVADQ